MRHSARNTVVQLTNPRVVKSPKMSLREWNLSDYPLDLCNENENKMEDAHASDDDGDDHCQVNSHLPNWTYSNCNFGIPVNASYGMVSILL